MIINGKILGINTSDGLFNLLVQNELDEQFNLKTSCNEFLIGNVYQFEVEKVVGERVSYHIKSFVNAEHLEYHDADKILRAFIPASTCSLEESYKRIYKAIEEIKNPVIHSITLNLIKANEEKYFIYPAASRLHHAYVGGLVSHSLGMLEMANAFIKNYPYLKKDYLYAGIILHDLGKLKELTGIQNTEYSLDGQLLGHSVIGAMEIEKMADSLGYKDNMEVKLLKHLLISHHGQLQFGAAKRPMTPEAIALWYIDTIDSKLRVLGEELSKTEEGAFTSSIGVLDKLRIYKD